MRVPTIQDRSSGLLLHPTSLPGRHGSGDLGDAAYRFADFLVATRQSWWQTLPLHPIGPGNSPYRSMSVFALSPMLISLELLERDGLLTADEARPDYRLMESRVHFRATRRFRERALRAAFGRFRGDSGHPYRGALEAFRAEQKGWLEDFTLFAAVKQKSAGLSWTRWPEDLRDRAPAALARWRSELAESTAYHEFLQLLAYRQWLALRGYCNERGIGLIGDLPIYVDHESADVWTHPGLFFLDEARRPALVAGVPPDMFSATGQLWGNPLYRWDALKERGFEWWIERLRAELQLVDIVRLDHFIGFHRYWAVQAQAKTAQDGQFHPGPGPEFFVVAEKRLGGLPLIAEDLGVLTPEVEQLRDRFDLPGMRILQFAFDTGSADNTHLPHHYPRNCVVYTGTHDNDTTVGWFFQGHGAEAVRRRSDLRRDQAYALDYLGTDPGDMHWSLVRLAFGSVANIAIVPVQDILGLGTEARMNFPGTPKGNWGWRMVEHTLTPQLADRLRRMTETFGRARS
jgi:4-alpha-glucanotransferase